MRQTRAFCKLILRPAPLLSICGYGRENIFHLHHPFACVLRKLYFCLSLLFNNFNRIILTIYTSKRRMISVSQKSCFFIGHRETPEEIYPVLCAAVEEHIVRYGVTEFIVGRYGCFDGLAAKAVKTAKLLPTSLIPFVLEGAPQAAPYVTLSQTGQKDQRRRKKNLFLAMVTKICYYGIIVVEILSARGRCAVCLGKKMLW